MTAQSTWRLLGRFGYHLISLVMIVVFLAMDMSAVRAVVYATAVQIVLSFLDREHRLTPVGSTARWAPGFGACFPWLRYAPPQASSPR